MTKSKFCNGNYCNGKKAHAASAFTTQSMCKPCTRYNQRPYTWRTQKIRRKGRYFTYEDYDDLFAQQGGRCALCGDAPPGDKYGFAVDHDSDRPTADSNTRALLCFVCNTHRIGKFRDDPAFLQLALDYLRHYGANDGRSGVKTLSTPVPRPRHE